MLTAMSFPSRIPSVTAALLHALGSALQLSTYAYDAEDKDVLVDDGTNQKGQSFKRIKPSRQIEVHRRKSLCTDGRGGEHGKDRVD